MKPLLQLSQLQHIAPTDITVGNSDETHHQSSTLWSLFVCTFITQKSSSSSVASIPMKRSCVHNAAPGDTVLITPSGHVEAKVQWSKESPSPQSSTRWLTVYQAHVSIPGWNKFSEQQRLHGSGPQK